MGQEIAERYQNVAAKIEAAKQRRTTVPKDAAVTLVVVTKNHDVAAMREAIAAGATNVGENRVQELLEKYNDVSPVRWHLIGHLQTNKVRQVIDRVVMIHSVDSLKLAREINKRAAGAGITMDVLIDNLLREI